METGTGQRGRGRGDGVPAPAPRALPPTAALPALVALPALLLAACGGGGNGDAAADTAAAGSEASARGAAEAGAGDPLLHPERPEASRRAPDVYRVRFETSEGPFTVEVHRSWAPRGADRLYNLVRLGFFDGSRFFRVLEGFVAQFGLSGRPEVDSAWRRHPIPDDSVRHSNVRGTLTFASAGEDTRTTQLFVNLADNPRLDGMGFAPVGEVVEGMEVVDGLYAGYGEGAPRGSGPSQARILREGNAYLEEEFPELDRVEEATVVEMPGRGGDGDGPGGSGGSPDPTD